jgi:LysR family transcriptional regulator, glycine cleavage system transcriptional activator
LFRLPPLNALKAFEVAARRLSFKSAAEELCVSQGAVSRHIHNLEDFLGARLFERGHRHVTLTREGSQYLHAVRDALVNISNATNSVISNNDQRMLKLKMPPTCAIRWLVPRLARFHARHPDVAVQVTTSHSPVDFEKDDIDAGVHYGTDVTGGLMGERLFKEVLLPVLSPAMAGQAPRLEKPADLANCLLLHSIQRPDDWSRWLALAGVADIERDRGLIFENSSLTYQGVVDGLGIAIAQLAFVIDELKAGRLTAPFNIYAPSNHAYYFVFPKARARIRKIRQFHDWIAHEGALTREVGAKYGL